VKIRKTIDYFNGLLIQAQKPFLMRDFDFNTPILFTLSTGRSGSKMLATILNNSESIIAIHEEKPHLFDLRTQVYQKEQFYHQELQDKIIAGQRFKIYHKAIVEKKLIADTSPFLSFFSLILAEIFPNSKFLFVYRKPEEFVRSGMRRGWYLNHPNDIYRLKPKPNSMEFKYWGEWSQFKKICWLWSEYNTICHNLITQLPVNRKMIMPISNFWEDPCVSFKKLFEFINVQPLPEDLIRAKIGKPINAQANGNYPEIDSWSKEQINLIEQMCGATLKTLNCK
jgi:hypothetical protein